uniref:Uncharacterized protein n=1 Tax=Lepeophtheirus salmonis TaxID=72036 RepID=A0A0K2SV68_LEPSM
MYRIMLSGVVSELLFNFWLTVNHSYLDVSLNYTFNKCVIIYTSQPIYHSSQQVC